MNSNITTNFFSATKVFFKNLFFGFAVILLRIKKSILMMTLPEKRVAILFLVIGLTLTGIKSNQFYRSKTQSVPDVGGSYKEAVAGELKFLNPVSAASDIDQAVSDLIFSSLVKFNSKGNVVYDAAKSYSVSPDNLTYTFVLRDNVYFHNGDLLTPADIIYTVEMIQKPEMQSPLYNQWKDVVVAEGEGGAVTFTLPKAYGPFIYKCDFGILPSNLSPDEFSKKIVGSGPYKYASTKKDGIKFVSLDLTRNGQYYGENHNVKNMEFDFFSSSNDAKTAYDQGGYTGLSGIGSSAENAIDLSFNTSRRLALIPNLRTDKLKDANFRKSLFGSQNFPDKATLSLATLDAPAQRDQAEKIKTQFSAQNVDLSIKYLSLVDFKKALDSKSYELLLNGFDFGHDRDPYVYWHTSQLSNQNYAGYSDLKADISLEDARMTQGSVARNALYDQFFSSLADQSMITFYDPIKFNFVVDGRKLKGTTAISGTDPASRFVGFGNWFMEEKRVRK